MKAPFTDEISNRTIAITPVETAVFDAWLASEKEEVRKWVTASGFSAKPGEINLVASPDGGLGRILLGVENHEGMWDYAGLPTRLPNGAFELDVRMSDAGATAAAIGWALGGYKFERYKTGSGTILPTLVWPSGADRKRVSATVDATVLVRDLINTPAEDMGPSQLAEAARSLGRSFGARTRVVAGDSLLKQNYPTIHAVGRAGDDPPRLIDLVWGNAGDPKVTIIGKGVCFDTGGLDIKPADGMLRMKKDMAGGAHALGLAHMIMAMETPVRLRVLIPAVENSISGNAIRPLDVVRTRKGLTVEIGNTDAEGRLIMCDALAEADRQKPKVIIDFATLTGAARVALGADLPALFSNSDDLAGDLIEAGKTTGDPIWRMPLWRPYRSLLDSKVADINNVSEGRLAGAITAALYLEEFVSHDTPWAHFDIMAWNATDRPGRPSGGEAQAMRAAFRMIERRFDPGPREIDEEGV